MKTLLFEELLAVLCDAINDVTLCPTCDGSGRFTPECHACLCGEHSYCTCASQEEERCPHCNGCGRLYQDSETVRKATEIAQQFKTKKS